MICVRLWMCAVAMSLVFELYSSSGIADQAAAEEASPKIAISEETTYLTEPLTKAGTVDYVAALNQRRGNGVTAENNSVVLFWRGIGIEEMPETVRVSYFKLLGVEAPPLEGDYLVSLASFIKQKRPRWDSDRIFDYYDQIEPTSTGPWRAEQFPLVAEWLDANRRPLKLLAAGARRDRFYSPIVRSADQMDGDAAFSPLVQSLRDAASMFETRAMLNLGEGRVANAWRDLETCFHIARGLTSSGSLGLAIVGSSAANKAFRGTRVLVQFAEMPVPDLDRIQQQLRDASSFFAVTDETRLAERCAYLEFIITRARLDPGRRKEHELLDLKMFDICFGRKYEIDWNEVLRLANEHFSTMADLTRIDDPRERIPKTEAFSQQLGSLNGRLPRKNDLAGLSLLGDLEDPEGFAKLLAAAESPRARAELAAQALSSYFVGVWSSFTQVDERQSEQCRLTQIAVALAAYRRDRSEYPPSLAKLAPAYLATIPRSAHTGNEFAYQRAGSGYVLTSAGSAQLAGTLYDTTVVDRRERQLVLAAIDAPGVLQQGNGEVYRINLTGADFGDEDLARLVILAEAQELSLRGTGVTDRGLAKLQTFNRLWSLDLGETAITDAGLKHVRSLANLRFLEVDRTNVSDEAVAELQQALPECEISR